MRERERGVEGEKEVKIHEKLVLTLPLSTSFVVMTMIREFSCHIIRQKSSTVAGRQP